MEQEIIIINNTLIPKEGGKMIDKNELDIRTYSPLALAYMGDCIFDLYIRTHILKKGNMQANKLHTEAKKYVCASFQSKLYLEIFSLLKRDEQTILRSGRNATSNTKAKNSTLIEYKNATGLEALFGYLYLKGDKDRTDEIFEMCLNIINNLKE